MSLAIRGCSLCGVVWYLTLRVKQQGNNKNNNNDNNNSSTSSGGLPETLAGDAAQSYAGGQHRRGGHRWSLLGSAYLPWSSSNICLSRTGREKESASRSVTPGATPGSPFLLETTEGGREAADQRATFTAGHVIMARRERRGFASIVPYRVRGSRCCLRRKERV